MAARAQIVGAGSATPPEITAERFYEGFYRPFYGRHDRREERRARLVFRAAGVQTRHCAVDPTEEDVASWTTGQRMKRFGLEAPPLGARAVERALEDAGLRPRDVDELVVASCTGYGTPGLDLFVAGELGMRPDVGRVHIGHMGCYAAIPALKAASDGVAAREKVAVVLCLELPSLHVQPYAGDFDLDKDQWVSHALFADAAAAVVLAPGDAPGDARRSPGNRRTGPEIARFESVTDHASAGLMTWTVTDMGFRMGLSPEVPKVVGGFAEKLAARLLEPEGLAVSDVGSWAVHPGGPEILDAVQKALGLPADLMTPSWDVLRDYGNCSSATVLLILERLLKQAPDTVAPDTDKPSVALAFGPGLSCHAALMKPQPAEGPDTAGTSPLASPRSPRRPEIG